MISPPPHHVQRAPRAGSPLLVVWRLLLGLLLGAVVGLIGTVGHRMLWGDLPVGPVLGLALTLSAAVLCRAWSGVGTLLACGAGWLVTVQVLAAEGPGGDVLVPADAIGYVWTYGGLVLFAVAAFLPRRWFVDDPDAG
ncbi:DUF6113 family protein [Isoptericola sediminis]|uniref:DUF6113 family protein n=1 Tax=Isoptericola sediminis TaxID=2733572 RepID=UPI0031B61A01